VERGFDTVLGARPLRRAVERYLEDPLAEEILRGSFQKTDSIIVHAGKKGAGLQFKEATLAK
jgi:ATP-dependent Clp protease ATP-binding subunit ClpC